MLNDKVIRTAFLISFVGHCFLLGIPGINIRSTQLSKPEDVVVRIEIEKPLLLPKIDVMGEEKKLKKIVKRPKSPEPEPVSQSRKEIVLEQPVKESTEEEVEVIDPAQEAMLRYQDMVKQRIEERRRYPYRAKKQGIEGIVSLSFIVLSNGLSQNVKIIHSSDSKILDEEAVETVKRADPFPSIPKEMGTSFVQMEVSIVFRLN